MKEKFTYIAVVVALIFGFVSCNLNRDPYGISNFWNTEKDVEAALVGVYAPLYEEDALGYGCFWTDAASDDMIPNRPEPDEDKLIAFQDGVNNLSYLYNNWKLMYEVVRRANDVLQHAPDLVKNRSHQDMIMAEADFMCGYAYFFLAKRYGGLPFYDLQKAKNGQYRKPKDYLEPRQTKDETYRRIANYLETSINLFLDAQQNDNTVEVWHREGLPSLGAAYGLLAKVYAYWGKYDKAELNAQKIIQSHQYELDKTNNNGFAHLFSPQGDKGDEVLFNLINKDVRHQGTVTSIVLMSKILTGGSGWYYFAPTKSLFEAYQPGDLRRRVTVLSPGDQIDYLGVKRTLKGEDISDMMTGYMCAKYSAAYNTASSFSWESGEDIPLLRYSDVLLIEAEAQIFLNGGGPKNPTFGVPAAASSFNQVRVRAFGGDQTKAIAAPTFTDLVRERRCELAYEDSRHYDLVRWGLAKEIYAKEGRIFDPVKNASFPLPQKELDNTDGILFNNPRSGYSDFN